MSSISKSNTASTKRRSAVQTAFEDSSRLLDHNLSKTASGSRRIEGAERAMDTQVKKCSYDQLVSASGQKANRLRCAVDSAKYEQCRNNPAGEAFSFIVNVAGALHKHNVSVIDEDTEPYQNLIQKLVVEKNPLELQERIKQTRERCINDQKACLALLQSSVSTFHDVIAQGQAARAGLKCKQRSTNCQGLG